VVVQAMRAGQKHFYDAPLEKILHHFLRGENDFFQCIALYWGGDSSVFVL